MFISCVDKRVIVDGKDLGIPCAPQNNCFSSAEFVDKIQVIFRYETITNPKTAVDISYTVNAEGKFWLKIIIMENQVYQNFRCLVFG